MSALAIESPRELLRWMFSATLVLCAHAGLAAAVIQWHDLQQEAEPFGVIAIELAPVPVAPLEEENPIVEPVQTEVPVEQALEKPVEPIDQAPEPDVVLEAQPEQPKPTEMQVIPQEYVAPHDVTEEHAAIPAAPTQGMADANARALARWRDEIRNVIERNKRSINISRRGLTQVAFSVDRAGRVVGTRVVSSSGSAALDEAAVDIIKRASQFPPPPAALPGDQISISVPISFAHK
jgi:periplasmic protein TonB